MKSFMKMLCLTAGIAAGLGTSTARADDQVQDPQAPTAAAGTPSSTATVISTEPPATGDSMTVYKTIHPNRPLLLTGAILLVGTYVPTVAIQAGEGRPQDKDLYIPVVGPWVNLANRECNGCANETRDTTLIVASGILQGAGAALAIASLFVPEKVEAARIHTGTASVQVLPSRVGVAGYGVGALGTF